LIIFDLLVLNNDYLVGKTFGERITMLDELYGTNDSEKDYLHSISDNVYRVKSYNNNFKPLFDRLMQIDMIEGLVLKRRNARLEIGNTEDNNTKSQIKARKKTKSYKF
jgi:ATP-dependent DNA ligase